MNDDFPHRVVASCIVAPLYAVLLYILVIRPGHQRFREKFPIRCLHYSILDVWGLTLGLTPTLLSIAYGFREGVVIENHIAYVLIAELLGLSQLSGAYLALLKVNEAADPELRENDSSWNSPLTLLMGTIAGVGLLAIIPVVALATGIALWLIYLIFQLPFGVPMLVVAVYLLIWFVWRLGTRP
jgi:hypothetical protein